MSDSHEAIRRLMYEYAECVDLAKFEELGQLFAHGRIGDGKQWMTKPEQVVKHYSTTNKVHANGTLCTRHLATNTIIDVDEDAGTASSRSYYVVLQATDQLPFQPIVGGRYHDEFERVDGKWRFAERIVIVDQIGNMSEHLSIDLRTHDFG